MKHNRRKQHPTTPPTTPPLSSYILSDGSKCSKKTKERNENPINSHIYYASQYKHVCIECSLGVSFTSPTIITPPPLNPSSALLASSHNGPLSLIALLFLFISFWIQNSSSLSLFICALIRMKE